MSLRLAGCLCGPFDVFAVGWLTYLPPRQYLIFVKVMKMNIFQMHIMIFHVSENNPCASSRKVGRSFENPNAGGWEKQQQHPPLTAPLPFPPAFRVEFCIVINHDSISRHIGLFIFQGIALPAPLPVVLFLWQMNFHNLSFRCSSLEHVDMRAATPIVYRYCFFSGE